MTSPRIIIEVSPNEPRASVCLIDGREVSTDGEVWRALRACCASGDVDPACAYVRDHIGAEFRIVARNEAGAYENRLATDAEMTATAQAIYFESSADFTDRDRAALYLIWEAAMEFDTGA